MLERLLIVGLGSIGSRHARIARELSPGVQITALRHRECPEVPLAGIDYCVSSLDAALAARPQSAVIASPASHHLEVALALGRAGVHLLVEKPIAIATEGVAELIHACSERGVTLMLGYNLRFSPSLQRLRALLQERRVGRVLSVRAEVGQFLPSWRPDGDYRRSVSASAKLGGGVLLELSHEIDYLRWLFGDVEWVSAILRRQSSLEIDVEDTAHLVLGFAAVPGDTPLVASLNMDFVRHDTTRACTIIGETGSLRWNAGPGTVELLERGDTSWRILAADAAHRDDTYRAEWCEFLNCIATGRRPLVSGEDGLAVLHVVEAARESSATGRVVRLAAVGSGQPATGRAS